MWRSNYQEDWERRKTYLIRSLFQDIPGECFLLEAFIVVLILDRISIKWRKSRIEISDAS